MQSATILTSNTIATATEHINMINVTAAMNQHKFKQIEKSMQQYQGRVNHLINRVCNIE